MNHRLRGRLVSVGIARPTMNRRATYEGGSSRLARFSRLCTNSTVVYHRAGIIVRATDVRHYALKGLKGQSYKDKVK